MAILADKLPWGRSRLGSTSSLLFRQECAFDSHWTFFQDFTLCFDYFAGPFFSAVMRSAVSHQGRVSAGQLCNLLFGLMHVWSRTAIHGQSTVVDDATAMR